MRGAPLQKTSKAKVTMSAWPTGFLEPFHWAVFGSLLAKK